MLSTQLDLAPAAGLVDELVDELQAELALLLVDSNARRRHLTKELLRAWIRALSGVSRERDDFLEQLDARVQLVEVPVHRSSGLVDAHGDIRRHDRAKRADDRRHDQRHDAMTCSCVLDAGAIADT